MKKKNKRKFSKKISSKKPKKLKIKKVNRKFRKAKKKKKLNKLKKKQPLERLKKIKLPKFKIPKIKIKIKIKKKKKNFNLQKQLSSLATKIINLALNPLFVAYDRYREKTRLNKLKAENERVKEEEKIKKERQRIILEQKQKELREKIQFAKQSKAEIQIYLRQAEREARKEKAIQQKKILENLKISKQIEKFEERMNRETLALEKYALQNLKEAYEPTLEKIQAIKDRYKKLQEEKLRSRIEDLGIELSGDEDKTALLERERQFIFEKSQIENTLLPFTRSLRSMAFFINKNYLSRNMSPLKVQDLSMEHGEIYLKWLEEESSEDFLILCYVKDNNLNSGKIVLEIKTNPEKHTTLELKFKEIFLFQDTIIDNTVEMLEKIKNQKKAS
tara:strand:- start:426 stop:1592 length:1167 start_codon:yes stop_codon:yes gene_type:complete